MIETVSNATGEIVSLEEVKRELNVWDSADDQRVRLLIEAARRYCEEWAELSLVRSATVSQSCATWPVAGFVLGRPPASSVISIAYYDTDNNQQTVAANNYRFINPTVGRPIVELDAAFTKPSLYDRSDAVTVAYTTGWGDNAPADLKAAVILVAKHLDMEDETGNLGYARTAAMRLLTGRAAWSYR